MQARFDALETHVDNRGWQDLQENLSQEVWMQRRNTHDGAQEVDKNEEPHRETAKAAKFGQNHQLAQVMDCRIDPPSPL